MKIGFDNEKYLQMQSEHILERISKFDNKLYLEFGGKLFDDMHASRVLPGFLPDSKVRLLQTLKDKTEIIVIINAADIERKKIRADFGITYDADVLRLIDNLRSLDIYVSAIVITQFNGQPSAEIFKKKLEVRGERVFVHRHIKGYPNDVDTIVSDNGYGANEFVPTTRPLVVVTAPGPGSGKLATCLSQLYHEHKNGVNAGYAKFETFPIWNIPLKHPVNVAYEAATADLNDVNMIDPYHLEAYGVATVNYNRDVEAFPVVKKILSRITDKSDLYKSPTDMGVNMVGMCMFDDAACAEASKQEIIRRYYKARCGYKNGQVDKDVADRIESLMQQQGVTIADRPVVAAAKKREEETGVHCLAMQLEDGFIVTGKSSALMSASSALLINALKHLTGISDDLHLLSPVTIEPIITLKRSIGSKTSKLNLHETLLALSISGATNPVASFALSKLPQLAHTEAHSTRMLSSNEETYFNRMKVNLTCDPEFLTKNLYIQ